MLRMFTYGVIGLVVGFIVVLVLLMGALPAASGGVLVGAVKSIQGEFREMRCEMKSMQTSFHQTGEKLDKLSTQ